MSGNINNRRNWTRSLTAVLLLALTAAVIGCLADSRQAAHDRVYLRNTAGPVLFDHTLHSTSVESCGACHHPLFSAVQSKQCAECHDEGFAPDDVNHESLIAIHNRNCAACHEESAELDNVASCRNCHSATQQAETPTKSCTECHDDSYTPDIMEHDEYLQVEEHSCLGCHAPRTLSEAYHTSCTGCHLEMAPKRFTKPGGEIACGACHLR